jgi:hypothetical protein
MSRTESKRRQVAIGALVSLGTLAILLLISEIGLRLAPRPFSFKPEPPVGVGERPNRPSRRFDVDSSIGWRMRPGIEIPDTNLDGASAAYHASAEGFRIDDGAPPTSRTSSGSIALIGDSFTFGVGLDYSRTFAGLLAAELPTMEVDNYAMIGFGMDQMWMTLRSYVLPRHPALVIMAFIDDDFDRSLTAYRNFEGMNKPKFILVRGQLRRATRDDQPGPVAGFLERHSALWMLGRVASRRISYSYPVGNWWKVNRAIIDSVQADCDRAGTRVLFVRLPTQGTRPPFDVLHHHMQERGHAFLDLAVPGSVPPGIYFPRDGHFNAAGHTYVADALARWVKSNMPDTASR